MSDRSFWNAQVCSWYCGCGCIIFLHTQQNFWENVLGRVHFVHRDIAPIVNILVSKSTSELGFRLQIYVIKHENQKWRPTVLLNTKCTVANEAIFNIMIKHSGGNGESRQKLVNKRYSRSYSINARVSDRIWWKYLLFDHKSGCCYSFFTFFGTNADILIFMLVQASLIWGFYLSISRFSSSDTQNIAFTKIVTTFCLPPVPFTKPSHYAYLACKT